MALSGIKTLLFGQAASLYDQETKQEITLKVLIAEELSASASVTGYPVEADSDFKGDINDHVIKQPDIINLEAIFTDPNRFSITDRATIEDKLGRLRYWMEDGILLGYSGPCMSSLMRSVYQLTEEDLIITQMDAGRSIENGTATAVSITLQQVTIVTSELASIKLPQAVKAVAQKGTGAVATAEVAEENAGKGGFLDFLKDCLQSSGEAAGDGMVGGWY